MTPPSRFRGRLLVLVAPLCLAALAPPAAVAADLPKATPKIDYNRDIRPILADACYACHGPDEKQRKRKLRFDVRDSAVAELSDSLHAVVPGKSADSALIDRITETDPDRRMPPAKTGKTLTPQQIELLRAWIDQGALRRPLGLRRPGQDGAAEGRRRRLGAQPHRRLRPRPAGAGRTPPLAGSGQNQPHSSGDARPDRPAADAG